MSGLIKSAVSKSMLRVSQSRQGRRPMHVDTLLRKEKEGTLYKKSNPVGVLEQLEDVNEQATRVLGMDPKKLLMARQRGKELAGKVFHDIRSFGGGDNELAKKIAATHFKAFPNYYEHLERMEKEGTGPVESKLPWYTTAGLGTAGALSAPALVPEKYKMPAAVLGTLLGTGLGLEGGTALGKALDKRKEELTKSSDSGGTMQRMFGEGAARGIDHYVMQDFGLSGKPATAKVQRGDVPSRDQVPDARYPDIEHSPSIREMDLAPKVAAAPPPLPLKRLVSLARGLGRAPKPPAVRAGVGLRLPTPAAPRGYGPTPTADIIAQPGTLAAKKQRQYLQQRLQQVAGGEAAPGARGSVEWAERGGGYASSAGLNAAEFANLSPQARTAIEQAAKRMSTPGAAMSPEQAYALMAGSGHGRGGTKALVQAATGRAVPARSGVQMRTVAQGGGLGTASTVPATGPLARADMTTKVGALAVDEQQFPTLDDGPERDQASARRREQAGYQHMRDQAVPGYNPNWHKEAHVHLAMREEFQKLAVIQLNQKPDYQDAQEALGRLQQLEASKPTLGEVSRAATAGGTVGTGAQLVGKMVSGDALKSYGEALRKAGPGWKGKLVGLGKGTFDLGRQIAGGAAGSATFGASLPLVRRQLEQRAEIGRLKDYLEDKPRSRLRRAASEYVGV